MKRSILPLLTFAVLVVVAGGVHGIRTDRWVTSEELRTAVGRLDQLPEEFGDWVETGVVEYDAETLAVGGISGYHSRKYRNRTTGVELTTLIVCGRGGPISVHTPDLCYGGAGYRPASQKTRVPATTGGGELFYSLFVKPDAVVPQRLDIYWAWSRDGSVWAAPDSPRSAFARYPAVYKLYVVRDAAGASTADHEPVKDFLGELLPVLKSTLGVTPD